MKMLYLSMQISNDPTGITDNYKAEIRLAKYWKLTVLWSKNWQKVRNKAKSKSLHGFSALTQSVFHIFNTDFYLIIPGGSFKMQRA